MNNLLKIPLCENDILLKNKMETIIVTSLVFLCLLIFPNASHSPNPGQEFNTGHQRNETGGFMSDMAFRFVRGGTGISSPWTFSSTAARSRIVETKYGRVQGLSVALFSNIHYSTNRNFPLKNKIVEVK